MDELQVNGAMGNAAEEAIQYCRSLVYEQDEDLSLALGYVPAQDLARTTALYALAIELRRIPTAVSEPPLGEIRLQWWRDALDEIIEGKKARAHPVITALKESNAIVGIVREQIEVGIDSRARLLYGDPFDGPEDLIEFFRAAEGWLAGVLVEEKDAAVARAAAASYAAARWGEGHLKPAQTEALLQAAKPTFLKAAPALSATTDQSFPSILYLALTRTYLRGSAGPFRPVAKRWRLFRAMASGRL